MSALPTPALPEAAFAWLAVTPAAAPMPIARAALCFAVALLGMILPATGLADPPVVPSGSLAERLKGVQNADNPLPDWPPISSGDAAASHEIVMAPGLVVVTAINQGGVGDYESFKKIDAMDGKSVHLQYNATLPASARQGVDGLDPAAGNKPPIGASCTRTIDVADMQSAHGYGELFCGGQDEHTRGTTAISVSTEVLTQLRANKEVAFHYQLANMLKAFEHLGRLVDGPGIATLGPHSLDATKLQTISCLLRRVEPTDLAVPVLLDDQPVKLPAVHAACVNTMGKVDFYFLDHPGDPMVLAWQGDAIGGRLQVIKIQEASLEAQRKVSAAAAASAAAGSAAGGGAGQRGSMEKSLQDRKPVDVYGIYFDFNSSTVRPESGEVLGQIAQLLRDHPDWKLRIAGHTDNIGEAQFNMGLSQRRAAAVKESLVSRYGIAADRLTTTGFGATQPVAGNDTLEGRARNRRVELQRL